MQNRRLLQNKKADLKEKLATLIAQINLPPQHIIPAGIPAPVAEIEGIHEIFPRAPGLIAQPPMPLDINNMTADDLIQFLYEAILAQRSANIDSKKNINSKIIPFADGKAWVRESDIERLTIAKDNHENVEIYNYLRIFYAYLIGAMTISKIHGFNDDAYNRAIHTLKSQIDDEFNQHVGNPHRPNIDKLLKILAQGKGDLINLLKTRLPQQTRQTLNKSLDQAKDWAGLEQPSFPIITILKTNEELGNKTIIIFDEPCTKLTSTQQSEFDDLDTRKWYRELTPFNKKLILHYRDKIKSGRCVIPSQLRSIVPELKNAYEQHVFIQESEHEFTEISNSFHSGTAAYLSHKDNAEAIRVTENNLRQQKLNSGTDATIMICLNSNVGDNIVGPMEKIRGNIYVADDSKILELTRAASLRTHGEQLFYAKVVLNGFRAIEYNDYSGITSLLEIVQTNLRLLGEESQEEANTLREYMDELGDYLDLMNGLDIFDRQVKGLDIVYCLSRIALLNNRLALRHLDINLLTMGVWFGCASGENRTGITHYNNVGQSVIDYLIQKRIIAGDNHVLNAAKTRIFDLLSAMDHVSVMSGHQGSTFGTDGIRSKSSGSARPYHQIKKLVSKPSDLKSLPPEDREFNETLERLNTTIQEKKAYLRMNAGKNKIPREEKDTVFATQHLLPAIVKLAERALEYRHKIATDDKKTIYIDALNASNNMLRNPKDGSAFNHLCTATQAVKTAEDYEGHYKRSPTMSVSGILLGIVGIGLITIAALSIFATGGISAPLAVPVAITATLIAKSAILGVVGLGVFSSGFALTKIGLFSYKPNLRDDLSKIKDLVKPRAAEVRVAERLPLLA